MLMSAMDRLSNVAPKINQHLHIMKEILQSFHRSPDAKLAKGNYQIETGLIVYFNV
jgi:hypothetical protein